MGSLENRASRLFAFYGKGWIFAWGRGIATDDPPLDDARIQKSGSLSRAELFSGHITQSRTEIKRANYRIFYRNYMECPQVLHTVFVRFD